MSHCSDFWNALAQFHAEVEDTNFDLASVGQENFLKMVGLLCGTKLAFRQSLEVYLLNPAQMVSWVAARASLGRFRATLALLRVGMLCTMQERRNTFKMQRVMRKLADPRTLINAAPETLPYRNQSEIKKLFKRLGFPVEQLCAFASCCVARI
jgi:hypothetical protein